MAKLKAGAALDDKAVDDLEWIPTVTVDRKNAQGFTDIVMNNAYKIDGSKLPGYIGFMNGKNSYSIVQVSRIDNALSSDEEAKKAAETELRETDGALRVLGRLGLAPTVDTADEKSTGTTGG